MPEKQSINTLKVYSLTSNKITHVLCQQVYENNDMNRNSKNIMKVDNWSNISQTRLGIEGKNL